MAEARDLGINTDFNICPICLQTFRSPRSLPCLHSFCEQCISEYILRTDNKQDEKITTYPCPVCRALVTPTNPQAEVSQWGSLLPENCMLTSILTSSNEQQSECNPCARRKKSTKSDFWCRDCKEFMCISCNEAHGSFKNFLNHTVCCVENMVAKKYGIDITTISGTCFIHSSKPIEAFCFDHKQLCCVLCLTLSHRKCNDVQAIEEITKTRDEGYFRKNKVLPCLQTIIEDIVTKTQKQLKIFNDSVESSKGKASKVVACAKDKLDCLFISFTKELSILEDNEKSALEENLSKLDQVKTDASHIDSIAQFVCNEGTLVQQFIHNEHVKYQIERNMMPIIFETKNKNNVELKLEMNSYLDNFNDIPEIGKLSVVSCPENGQIDLEKIDRKLEKLVQMIGTISMEPYATYDRFIQLGGKTLACGKYLSENMIVCGNRDNTYFIAIDTKNGIVKNKSNFHYAKRLAVDRKRNEIYSTSKNGYFVKYHFNNGFKEVTYFKDLSVGGIAVDEEDVYVIVKDSIRKFKVDNTRIKKSSELTLCCKTNTECPDDQLNGLAINPKTKDFIYTSKDNEVICINTEGHELFRFKDEKVMKKPSSVIIHSSGYILVGNESGSVHVISSDGRFHYLLIEKCRKITQLCDIWLDQSEQTLFLCGNEFIEIYTLKLEYGSNNKNEKI